LVVGEASFGGRDHIGILQGGDRPH
jgi:hypothetical protein